MTPEQIDAALPRVPAGINSGDLTDPDERRVFVARLLEIFREASCVPTGGPQVTTWAPPTPAAVIVAQKGAQ